MNGDLEWEKKEIEVCKEDIVVVFNLGKLLLPKKRKIIDKVLQKVPSKVVEFDW